MIGKYNVTHPAVRDFLLYLELERDASPETIRSYREDLNAFLKYLSSEMQVASDVVDLARVQRSDIRRFLIYLKEERHNAPKTMNRKLTAIRSLYNFLVESEEWRLEKSPVSGMASFRLTKPLPVYLTLEEVEVLRASIQENSTYLERDYAIFMVFLQCGCRFSELLSLTLDSIDLQQKTLRVFGKGRKERVIPLTERTVKALQQYMKVRKPKVPTDVLFLNNIRTPLKAWGLRRIFRKAIERSKLEKRGLTPHKLRHTCLTLLTKAGVDVRTLQAIAGHSSVVTTQIYTHVAQSEVHTAMDKHPIG